MGEENMSEEPCDTITIDLKKESFGSAVSVNGVPLKCVKGIYIEASVEKRTLVTITMYANVDGVIEAIPKYVDPRSIPGEPLNE